MIFKRLKLKLLLALLICGSAYAQQRDAYVAIGDIYRSDGSIVIPEFLSRGINGVGTGVSIVNREMLANDDFEGITKLAKAHVDAVKSVG